MKRGPLSATLLVTTALLLGGCPTTTGSGPVTSQSQPISQPAPQSGGMRTNASSLSTEPLAPEKLNQIIQVYQAVVKYPPPSWQTVMWAPEESEFFKEQKGPSFIFEMIPKGESFEKWGKLFAVAGLYRKGLTVGATIAQTKSQYVDMCGRENFSVQKVGGSPAGELIVLYCQNSANGPSNIGYGDGVGEISVMWFGTFQDTSVKVYQHWRGPRFDRKKPETWPVPSGELLMMIRRMRTVFLTPTYEELKKDPTLQQKINQAAEREAPDKPKGEIRHTDLRKILEGQSLDKEETAKPVAKDYVTVTELRKRLEARVQELKKHAKPATQQQVAELRSAAEQGDREAQHFLGALYQTGDGVQKDDATAVEWFRKAADQRHFHAMIDLAHWYLHAERTPRERAEGYKWYLIASRSSDPDARKPIVTGTKITNLSIINTGVVTPNQKQEGERLAKEWLAKHPDQ